jgi:hypothetical protein
MVMKSTSGSVVTRKAFDFLSSKGEIKADTPHDGREMSKFVVKRLQVRVYQHIFIMHMTAILLFEQSNLDNPNFKN